MREYFRHINIPMLYLLIIIAAIFFLLCGCKTKYVAVPEYHYRDSVRVVHQRDSIIREIQTHIKDSMSVEKRGDTTIIKNFHYEKTFDYSKMMHDILDSLSTNKTDSVRVPYPVERQLTPWGKIKMDFGNAAIGISIAAVLVLIFYIIRWLRQKKILNF